jgi:8-oxo-dGTP pyrophosphatase MutT (NUDIX family)
METFAAFLDRVAARLDPVDARISSGSGSIHAAVALLLRPAAATSGGEVDGSAEILFIKRAERKGDPWSGHIAFPGGRQEARDADLLAAAVRETSEEVGIDVRSGGRILGRLPTIEPVSVRLPPIDVTPFVALAPEGSRARPRPGEIAEAYWVPLHSLRDAGQSAVVRRVVGGEKREWPAYPSPGGSIWGITERILTGFLARMAP